MDDETKTYQSKSREVNSRTIVKWARAHGKGCLGCKSVEKDVMVTLTIEGDDEFHDYFLTQEQAKALKEELELRLKQNENE